MSKSASAVRSWRKRCKERIVEAMGGQCIGCGYHKCTEALALHHLNPLEKDFTFGAIRANPKAWPKIVEELRKCVLVCHVCHTELHYGVRKLPDSPAKFNEEFADYQEVQKRIKELEKENNQNECPVCKKLKPNTQRTCSYACGARLKYRVAWDQIDLAAMMDTKSIVAIAEELGCSDGAVHKRLKKLGLK